MPIRHCVLIDDTGCQFQLGIWRAFDPWIDPDLLHMQGYQVRHTEARPARIEFHFRRVVVRLLRSLECLCRHARKYQRFLDEGALAGPSPEQAFEIPEQAGIAADSVFHYLTLFIDDLARIVPLVFTDEGQEGRDVDGFGALKTALNKNALRVPRQVGALFQGLNREDSWWSLGIKYRVGIRQRLTHYTDLIYFNASTKPGSTAMVSEISLVAIGDPNQALDLESGLRIFFSSLCEWLDELEKEILAHLSDKLRQQGIDWDPFRLPVCKVALPRSNDMFMGRDHYLYIPVCAPIRPR
jgi:hypothetical protein